MAENDKIQWHPGFYGATEIELREDRDNLEFKRELNLGKMPPRLDMLVIRKRTDEEIKNEIGKIFRRFNVMEYKSPRDELSINDFSKVHSYAGLFKCTADSPGEIPLDELTVTLVRQRKPKKLFADLKALHYMMENPYPGIYYVQGRLMFPTQIVVTDELTPEDHSALRVLAENAEKEDIRRFALLVTGFTEQRDKDNADAVLEVSATANTETYNELRGRNDDMCKALREIMKDEFDELELKVAAKTAAKYEGVLAAKESELAQRDEENARLRAELAKYKAIAMKG